ncbi:roundabout 2-like [Aphis craccivora]|uniref:Roundabout 2-like n=1 Tax=Aphis craccivora TaxID=307492 RepID=A0A6G0ZHA7_APHCR|nr:roundabout 2-like [Aphis craccivora]
MCGQAPRIIEHPTNMTVVLHEPATLNCKSDGDPQPEVRWYRDGRPIDLTSSVRKALLPEGSLLFLEASQGKRDSDSGTYWCIAQNMYGEAVSRKANLIVTCKYTNEPIIILSFYVYHLYRLPKCNFLY